MRLLCQKHVSTIVLFPILSIMIFLIMVLELSSSVKLRSLHCLLESTTGNKGADTNIFVSNPNNTRNQILHDNVSINTESYLRHHQVKISNYSTLFLQLQCPRSVQSNLILVDIINQEHQQIHIIVPSDTNEFVQILKQLNAFYQKCTQEQNFTSYYWQPQIFINWPTKPTKTKIHISIKDLTTIFPTNNFPLDSSIFIFHHFMAKNNSMLQLFEIYSIKNISIIHSVQIHEIQQPSVRRRNFHQIPILATAVDDPDLKSMISFSTNSDSVVEFESGYSVCILNDLRDLLNFRVQAVKADEYIVGGQIETNGSFVTSKLDKNKSDIGSMLTKGVADVSIPLSYIVPYRIKFLTPLHPLCIDRISVFFRQPPVSTAREIFSQPFSFNLWIALGTTWILTIMVMISFNYLEKFIFDDGENNHHWFELTLLWAISIICQKGWYTYPSTTSKRIIYLCGLILGLVPFLAYSASIISVLSSIIVPIKYFNDLRQFQYTLLANPLIQYGQFLADNNTSAEQVSKLLAQSYIDNADCVRKVLDKGSATNFAFVTTSDEFIPLARALNYSDSQICSSISSVPLNSVSLTSGFFLKKNSPFKEIFNSKILFTLERGLNTRYLQHLYAETTMLCHKSTAKSFQEELSLNDLFTAFVMIFISYCACFLIFCFEKLLIINPFKLRLSF